MKRFLSTLGIFAMFLPFMNAAEMKPQTASLVVGGGCFWCTEAAYEMLPGVTGVVSGYAGGPRGHPSYDEVSAGTTGHAEVIRIDYDPSKVTLERLLEYFWDVHDPTTLNRQGADEGTQYRSIILYADETQRLAAVKSREEAKKSFKDDITTEIVPLEKFWPAEGYHQDYFAKNPNAGYCRYVIKPKVDKLQKQLKAGAK